MKTISLVLLLTLVLSLSCSSTIYLPRTNELNLTQFDEIIILKNDYSYIMHSRGDPGYNEVRYMVKDTVEAIEPVFSLIRKELTKQGFSCSIWESKPGKGDNFIYLSYQDYWKGGLKNFMKIMVISVFNPKDELIYKIVSFCDTKGFHNYPTPTKQVPLMIEELSKHLKQAVYPIAPVSP